jgi:hypothetical protein
MALNLNTEINREAISLTMICREKENFSILFKVAMMVVNRFSERKINIKKEDKSKAGK